MRTSAPSSNIRWSHVSKTPRLMLARLWQRMSLFHRVALSSGAVVALMVGALLYSVLQAEIGLRYEEFAARVTHDLTTLAPTLAEQAVLGDYTVIKHVLAIYAERPAVERVTWIDTRGNPVSAAGVAVPRQAPAWFTRLMPMQAAEARW